MPRVAENEPDPQAAKVLRQVFAQNTNEAIATEDAIALLGTLHTEDQLRIAVALLHGCVCGRTMQEMLFIVRVAHDWHQAGRHPALDPEELDDLFEAFGIIPVSAGAR